MAEWLTDEQARALIGLEPAETSDDTAFGAAVEAAVTWVQGKRPDLFVPAALPDDPAEFTPGADVLLGTAMLAHRWYQRRSTPLGQGQYAEFGSGMLRVDPDIQRLLGLGEQGGFHFGAGRPAPYVEVE